MVKGLQCGGLDQHRPGYFLLYSRVAGTGVTVNGAIGIDDCCLRLAKSQKRSSSMPERSR